MDEDTMSCGAWGSDQLLDLVQGRMPAETAERARRHAAGCERCRAAMEELSLLASLSEAPLPLPAAATDAAVRNVIRQEAARRTESRPVRPSTSRIRILRHRHRSTRPSPAHYLWGAAAVGLFAILLGYALLKERPRPEAPVVHAPQTAPDPVVAPSVDPEPPVRPKPVPRIPVPPPDPAPRTLPSAPAPVPPAQPPPSPPPRSQPPRPTESLPAPVPDFGRVAQVTGKSERGGAALQKGDPVASGDTLVCRSGSLLVELADRSLVLLRPGASLAAARRPDQVVLKLTEGEIGCSVTPDPARLFIVESAQGTVTVKGTVFSVRASSSSASVAVAHGRVEARTDAGAVDVGEGERTSMSRSSRPGRPEPIAVERVFAWAREGGLEIPQRLVFLPVTSPQAELRAPMTRGRLFAPGSLSGEPAFAAVDSRTLPAFGGRFLAANRDDGGSITFTVDLRQAADWHLWGRFFFPGSGVQLWKEDREPRENDPNSFYVSVDGGPERVFGNLKLDPESKTSWYRRWHWGGDGTIEVGKGQPLALGRLAAGRHTIRIRNRDSVETSSLKLAPRLDAVCLSSDKEYRPRDEDFRR